MNKDQKHFLISFLKGVTLSCIVSLALYFFLILATSLVLSRMKGYTKDLMGGVLMQISYIISIWWFYVRREAYVPTERFVFREELRRYLREGGWMPAAIWGVLAILSEILRYIIPRNPISFIGVLNMPLMVLNIPILRAVIAYTVTTASFYALTLYVRKQRWKGDL